MRVVTLGENDNLGMDSRAGVLTNRGPAKIDLLAQGMALLPSKGREIQVLCPLNIHGIIMGKY